MKYWFVIALALAFTTAFAQDSNDLKGDAAVMTASTIKAEEIAQYLNVLAADDMEGRETGFPGNIRAAKYIASKFDEWGIASPPGIEGHLQEVAFTKIKLGSTDMQADEFTYTHLKDFVVIPTNLPADTVVFDAEEITFLGYGIDAPEYSDYAKAKDLEGKIILIYSGEPFDEDGNSLITGSPQNSRWSYSLSDKLKAAKEHGVAGVLMISSNFQRLVNNQRRFILGGRTIMGKPDLASDQAPHMLISSTLAETLMDKKKNKVIRRRDKIGRKGKLKPFDFDADLNATITRDVQSTPGYNVVAYIEGIDPKLKDEVVVVTAHYDHVGTRGDEIFNGADDNASGTSGVMEIAEAFNTARERQFGPRRSVLCMLVTGEEKGLLGSQYYTENPIFPIEQHVANINMDMIGRLDDKHETPDYTYIIGSDRLSTELHEINEEVNRKYTKLELDYTYNAKDDPNQFYYRSDHYNFAKNGIPAIFYFSGTHEDYHQPTDTADKINFEKAASIARLAYHTAWELANRDKRIEVDVVEGSEP